MSNRTPLDQEIYNIIQGAYQRGTLDQVEFNGNYDLPPVPGYTPWYSIGGCGYDIFPTPSQTNSFYNTPMRQHEVATQLYNGQYTGIQRRAQSLIIPANQNQNDDFNGEYQEYKSGW